VLGAAIGELAGHDQRQLAARLGHGHQLAGGDHAIRRCAAAQLGWAGQER
jgi:hypothetical protein